MILVDCEVVGLFALGGIGPTLSAIVLTYRTQGREGRYNTLTQLDKIPLCAFTISFLLPGHK
ncbi:hypothetical protein [Methanococcoides vulcani]|uniref:hypothetical protein n=1 Tax=Methanococcoides vulcani TaxID=1353158 RepID=UPI0015A50719|nr:hypothetical protein [Methanococcoides vulcani]